jgi:hypothetical protein
MCPYLRVLCSNLSMCSVECTVDLKIWYDGNWMFIGQLHLTFFHFSYQVLCSDMCVHVCMRVCKQNKGLVQLVVQQWYKCVCVYVCGPGLNICTLNKL